MDVERALAFQGSEKHETPVQVVRTKTTPPAAEKCEDPRELQKLMSEMLISLQSLESGLAERRKTDEAQRRDRRDGALRAINWDASAHMVMLISGNAPGSWGHAVMCDERVVYIYADGLVMMAACPLVC